MSLEVVLHVIMAYVMGAINVGAGIERQRATTEGNLNSVAFMTILITIAGAVGTSYQVKGDWFLYAIMSSGVLSIVLLMAWKAKKKKQQELSESEVVKRAAGFLVLSHERKILVVNRHGAIRSGWGLPVPIRSGWGLPVATCKPGEPAINAAYRALKKETEAQAVLLSHTPYLSWEADGYVVEVFAAVSKSTALKECSEWTDDRSLLTGVCAAYPVFNREMLEHFSRLFK
jgi:ADP-ribose pyrophosphatase YjhB (NUDIX family)